MKTTYSRSILAAFALAAISWSASTMRATTTFDVVKDYSLASNPNGVWSYGALSQTTGGAFTAFANEGSDLTFPGSQDWYDNDATMTVEKNTTVSTYTYQVGSGAFIIPPDQLRMDGNANIEAVRFTAPVDGVYNLSGLFQRNDDQRNSDQPVPVMVSVVQDGTTVLFQQANFIVYGSQAPFNFPALQLTAGSTLDFVLTPTVKNNDTTGLAVMITTDAVVAPTVTLTAPSPSVEAGSSQDGEFLLTLSSAQTSDVMVNFTIKGTATNGTDYVLLKATKKIKAGKTSKPIKIIPQGDLGGANKKTVVLALAPGDGYTVGTAGKVKVKITSGQ